MNILFGFLLIVVVAGIAVGCMLLVRRRAPEGGFVADGDRAAGVFGVIATGFSVLLGFLIFLAFESYDASRTGSRDRGRDRRPAGRDRPAAPAGVSATTSPGELVCYARWVVNVEWEQMEDGTLDEQLNPWGPAMFRDARREWTLETPVEQSGYDQWLEQTSTRQLARQDRIHGAAGVMPTPLWIALFFISLIVLGFILTFADSGGAGGRAGAVHGRHARHDHRHAAAAATSSTIPSRSGVGGLQPTAMERSLVIMDEALDAVGVDVTVPCDEDGPARRDRAGRPPPRDRDWVEIVATVLLSVAAVATAWSSYQAARWNGEQAKTASRVNATCASRRPAPRGWPRRRPRSTWPRSSSGWTPAPTTTTS